ncbi:hypothetical protein AVEN_161037-1 [Araneus ventricosus]|uniref:Uncharacterized protein n=1 Tax=Araneus ventricosus TaxID=182803 RepID=A0A4Y2L9M1_ARAVE|nr:hypothetical protein AVEN_161037-1 [Araneus ventricosus]
MCVGVHIGVVLCGCQSIGGFMRHVRLRFACQPSVCVGLVGGRRVSVCRRGLRCQSVGVVDAACRCVCVSGPPVCSLSVCLRVSAGPSVVRVHCPFPGVSVSPVLGVCTVSLSGMCVISVAVCGQATGWPTRCTNSL